MYRRFLILAVVLALGTAAFSQETCRVFFDLNYDTPESVASVAVKRGRMMPLAVKPVPEREGYRFGGWYTSPECLPQQEWRFGSNSSFYVPATDSMRVENSVILYAKWVAPKPVRSAEELDAIREDLYGWYVLEEDLDLSGIPNWKPIGEYEGSYEFAPGEWWRHAFKGILDGNGHTIRGLHITEIQTDKNGLFGTIANGEVLNLTMDGTRIELSAPRPYLGPLAGILKQDDGQVCSIRNCKVINTLIQVKTTNSDPTFHSFTGLCGGAWGGTLEDNYVSGRMNIVIGGTGGGELYAAPYLGEAYNDTRRCSSDYEMDIHFEEPQRGDNFKAYIGGLQASGTYIDGCSAGGRIRISGQTGGDQLYIGGLVGSERYGTVSSSSSAVKVEVRDTGFAQVGGIVGEFNSGYGAMGSAFGVGTTVVKDCSYVGKPVFRRVGQPAFGQIAGAGVPEPLSSPWGLSMDYKIENCSYKPR